MSGCQADRMPHRHDSCRHYVVGSEGIKFILLSLDVAKVTWSTRFPKC